MQHEDNPYHSNHSIQNPTNSLLGHLLEEAPTGRDIFHSYLVASHKQQPVQEQELEENQRFDLRTIQKQEFNRNFPEKLFPEMPDDEAFQMGIGLRTRLSESLSFLKKSTQINRTAYLNQNREDKIARYRQKKMRRTWARKISYDCRKVVADKRQRKNGRFVKKDEDKHKQWLVKTREPKIQIAERQEDIGLSFKVEEYYN